MSDKEFLNRELLPLVCQTLNEQSAKGKVVGATVKDVKIYNWSYIIILDVDFENVKETIYLKIPKELGNKDSIIDNLKNSGNAEKAKKEYATLMKLNGVFTGRDRAVRPLGFIELYNAIIMSEIKGDKLFELIRQNKLSSEKICDILERIGQMLSSYHRKSGIYNKTTHAGEMLLPYKGVNPYLEKRVEFMIHASEEKVVPFSSMLLGFEMRNIFYSVEDDRITFHDVIDIGSKPIYEDVAQFLVSMDLVNWGDIFPKPLPAANYMSFLNGYFQGEKYSEKILETLIFKEYLRFHKSVRDVFNNRNLPASIKKLVDKYYISRWVKKRVRSNFWGGRRDSDVTNYISETRNRYRDRAVAGDYQSGYDNGLDLGRVRNRLIAHFEKRAIQKALNKCEGVRVLLDMPCGTGKLTGMLAERYDSYVGADISREMMQEIKVNKEPITLIQVDGTAIPFKKNSFDAVVSLRLIHRLPSDVKRDVLGEFCGVSKKYIIFSFPENRTYDKLLMYFKTILGIDPEKIVMEPLENHMNIFKVNGYSLVKTIPVLTGVSNQCIFLFKKKNS